MSLQCHTLKAPQGTNSRTIQARAATTTTPDRPMVLLMARQVTSTLLTKLVFLLRITVMVVFLPRMEVTKDTHMEVTEDTPMEVTQDTHMRRTGRARLTLILIAVLRKDEPVRLLSRVEGALEEPAVKHYVRDRYFTK